MQQEYIVIIEMRAHAAARCGEADHHIVNAPLGQKFELFQQFGDFRHELVDGLHQQGPVTLWQLGEGVFGERAATQFPRAFTMLNDQA